MKIKTILFLKTLASLIFLITISCDIKESKKNNSISYKNENVITEVNMYEIVEFSSVGSTLRGKLYTPKATSHKYPIVIMAHGFSATIDGMTSDKYAEEFYKAGFAVLLYDHRNFGRSDGEPRQEINYWVQSRGYIDAIDFVHTLNFIDFDKIAIWGCSLSSGEVLAVGAVDDRVSAIIGQIPAFGDEPIPFEEAKNTINGIKEILLNEHLEDVEKTETKQMAIVSPYQQKMASALTELTAYRWFMEYGGRYNTHWQNMVSISKFKSAPENYHVGITAALLKAPILLVVAKNDEMKGASDIITRSVFEHVTQPKEIVEVGGGHFGLLH